jgi:hypothetical protein
MPTLPLFLFTTKFGVDVPTENRAFPAGVVEPIETAPAKVEVAVEDVAT